MNRRVRAIGFAAAAAICAGLAAGAAGGYRTNAAAQFGELRSVLVASEMLPARTPLSARTLRESLEVRRVPADFLPPGTLSAAEQLLGRSPMATIPAGGYVLASQLEIPGDDPPERPQLEPGRRPVEITVSAAGALVGARGERPVDVVITSEPDASGGAGKTYVAVRGAALLELRSASGGAGAGDVLPGPGTDTWIATLALTRGEALRLIHAESFARSVRLIER